MMQPSFWWNGFAGILLGLLSPLVLCAADIYVHAHLTNGETVSGPLGQSSSEMIAIRGDILREVPVSEIWVIDFPQHAANFTAGDYVSLNNGDRIPLSQLRVVDDELTANWSREPLRPTVEIPLQYINGLILDLPPTRHLVLNHLARLTAPLKGHDRIEFVSGDELMGEFVQMDAGLIEIETALGFNKLDQRRVRGIQFDADLQEELKSTADKAIFWLSDGSRCTAAQWQPRDGGTVQLTLVIGGVISIGWHDVVRFEQWSQKMVPLSSRDPDHSRYVPYLEGTTEPQLFKDLTPQRRPLALQGREYSTGFSVRPLKELTFRLQPDDVAFQTWVGIDDASQGAGDVDCVILLDDKPIWSCQHLTGQLPPVKSPRILLKDHQKLTLRTEFGASGDVGDLVDWGSPTLFKE